MGCSGPRAERPLADQESPDRRRRRAGDALVDAITAAKADARTWGATFDAMHVR